MISFERLREESILVVEAEVRHFDFGDREAPLAWFRES